jgi:hypothetical protein
MDGSSIAVSLDDTVESVVEVSALSSDWTFAEGKRLLPVMVTLLGPVDPAREANEGNMAEVTQPCVGGSIAVRIFRPTR